ncbi:MAG: molybdopterin-dependent oxidoreductase, partial [Deltaproteobacteria bacterium]|nr:molybdopterin-dependent oxidoreductase [Deltaproteobacteria bacterium]
MIRRDFLKLAGIAGAAALLGCDRPSREIIPYVVPPEDVVPGIATWYATTCRECPAGCGVLARNRNGRVVKLEGNPAHPINKGTLCAMGQAALQGLYDPDRLNLPLHKGKDGFFRVLSWQNAEDLLKEKLAAAKRAGQGRTALITDLVSGTMDTLLTNMMGELKSDRRLTFEPISYGALASAHQIAYGVRGIPHYRLDEADLIISFGADFLETWVSPVEQARLFASARRVKNGVMAKAVYVGPRMSVTAANADRWIPTLPGSPGLVALGMLLYAMEKGIARGLSDSMQVKLRGAARGWSLESIAARTGVVKETIAKLSELFFKADRPLAVGHISGPSGLDITGGLTAITLLNRAAGDPGDLVDFSRQKALGRCSPASEVADLLSALDQGKVDVLMVMGANPVYALPQSWNVPAAFENVPFIVSLAGHMDETTQAADLVLPIQTPLETWGDCVPQNGLRCIIQPVTGFVFPNARPAGDVLLTVARKIMNPDLFPGNTFYDYLRHTWRDTVFTDHPGSFEEFWIGAIQRGFIEEKPLSRSEFTQDLDKLRFSEPRESNGLHLVAFPHMSLFDGRGANKPWLQELPETITQITWDTWVEIHPDTAGKLGIRHGEKVEIQSPYGKIQAPAYVYRGVQKETLAIPMGRGHRGYGRFADGLGTNPMALFPRADDSYPEFIFSIQDVKATGKGTIVGFANTDGSMYDHGRDLALTVRLEKIGSLVKNKVKPPLPEGTRAEEDIYPAHHYPDYRWAMAIDLSRCIGCGACAVACYAENNVPTVGAELVREGREMSWLRIERYFDPEWKNQPRFLVMLCQHCYAAPCEYVCPVYAAHHSKEGLNEQIYNRCVGTRYCNNNCPYKVRRFNWLPYPRPEPLTWQFNPDVVVRQKGVMEKCSFCMQRIKEAHNTARNEGREISDGEITTACAQTCPTQAIVFGNLLDEESRVF